jgi:hypothetical protein
MKKMRTVLVSCLCLVAVFFLAGCASGPQFERVAPIPAGKSVVYVYRSRSIFGRAAIGTLDVNDKPTAAMRSGGYYPCICDPGEVKLSVTTEATNTATLSVKAGEEHFVKTTVSMGVFIGHLHLNEVSSDVGLDEIAGCCLLESGEPSDEK